MSDVIINGKTYGGVSSITLNKTDGTTTIYTEGEKPDLSQTTATADDVLEGKEFYNSSGEKVAGTYKDMLQARIDNTNSCKLLFYEYEGTNGDFINKLDTSNVTNMSKMFYICPKLKSLNLSGLDTSNVTDMEYMFYDCAANPINVSFNTSNVTTMKYMFGTCSKLTSLNLSSFDTRNVTTMERMFYECRVLTSLNLSNFNTRNVANMEYMFGTCSKLTSLNLSSFDTGNVTNMGGMFHACAGLTSLDLSNFNFSNVTKMVSMFQTCLALKTLIGIDLINKPSASQIFSRCEALENLIVKNIQTSIQLSNGTSYGNLLTLDSLLNTIKELWTNTGTSTLTLTIGTANTAKLADVYVKLIDITDEMRAEDPYIDNKAPFVQCESTDEGAMLVTEYVTTVKKWQLA